MKIIDANRLLFKFIIFIYVFYASTLYAGQTQIVLGSFLNPNNAEILVNKINNKIDKDSEFKDFFQNNSLTTSYKKDGKYFSVVVKPFNDSNTRKKVSDFFKPEYKGIYVLKLSSEKEEFYETQTTPIVEVALIEKKDIDTVKAIFKNEVSSKEKESNSDKQSVDIVRISLEEAVFKALNTNPGIKEKVQNLKSVKTDRDIVMSDYYPKVFVTAGVGKAKEVITPSFNAQSGERVLRLDNSISATMNVFNGYSTYYDSLSQEDREKSAESFLKEYKSSIVMETVKSYIKMMKQKAILQISQDNVLSHEEIYEKLKEYTESGMGKVSDERMISGRLTLAEVNKVVHENNFLQLKIEFETILGETIDISKLEEPIFDYILPEELEDIAPVAFKSNSSLLVANHNKQSSYNDYKKSQSTYYPTLDIELSESILDESGPYDYNVNSSQAMLYLNYSLFNGFADKATIEKEFLTYLQNNQLLISLKRDIVRQLGVTWANYIKIQEQLELLSKLIDYNQKTLENYYVEFGVGRRSLLDIIFVKNDYDDAKISYVSAKYDFLLSKFEILNTMGILEDYFLNRINKMQLTHNKGFSETRSTGAIIKNLSDKLKNKQDILYYDKANHESFDSMMKKHGRNDELNSIE